MIRIIARLTSAALGLWLMASSAILGYGNPARDHDRIVGPIIVALSVISISSVTHNVRWGVLPLGIWLLIAPWLLGFSTTPTINTMVVGVIVVALTFVHGEIASRFGGGWASLLPGRNLEGS
jgi:hypothetical protein